MTSTVKLRTVIIGLLGFAAAEEEILLTAGAAGAAAGGADGGTGEGPHRWAAVPLLAAPLACTIHRPPRSV